MRIGIIIGRIGGVDGVALETEKWISVLKRMGHEVFLLSGELQGSLADPVPVDLVPEMGFSSKACEYEQEMAFFHANSDAKELDRRIKENARKIYHGIEEFVEKRELDALILENALALPFHLSLGLGIYEFLGDSKMKALSHDHDFAWERGDRYQSEHSFVNEMIEQVFPSKFDHLKHAVINQAARDSLSERGIDSFVVPNVMDFQSDFGKLDEYNADLREVLGLSTEDILIFQVTRIIARKSIETAIDMISKFNDSRYKLIITGDDRDEPDRKYINFLKDSVSKKGLEKQVFFAGEFFDQERKTINGRKVYSLSDAYAHADAMSYFSTYEGFGNAFVEAVLAKVPVFVNNYEPVYKRDIGSLGFQTVMLEETKLESSKIQQMLTVLNEPALKRDWVEKNFELGKRHFSYDVLQTLLEVEFTTR